MSTPAFRCLWCLHIASDNRSCKAFPDGIPDEIYFGDFNHRKPYPGDNGIQFESRKKQKPEQQP